MSRSLPERIDDVLESCTIIRTGIEGLSQEQFAANVLLQRGVIHSIAIIGEASKHIPQPIRAQMPSIPWKDIIGMRDWLVHAYHKVDAEIVWKTAQTDIPALLRTLQAFKDESHS